MSIADARLRRFKKRFPEWVFADIRSCLRGGSAVGAVILECCAIDYLSRFHSGDPGHSMVKAKYLRFMERYFWPKYDPEEFYKFVRSGLIHGYEMDRKYIVIGSSSIWATSLNMKFDPKHKATLINPHALYEDVRVAFRMYVDDLSKGGDILAKFVTVWSSSPLERPQLSSDYNKFKHLLKN